jgi:hypothetical protein
MAECNPIANLCIGSELVIDVENHFMSFKTLVSTLKFGSVTQYRMMLIMLHIQSVNRTWYVTNDLLDT